MSDFFTERKTYPHCSGDSISKIYIKYKWIALFFIWHIYFILSFYKSLGSHLIIPFLVVEVAEVVPNNHRELEIKEKEEVMRTELEVSVVDARYYFSTREVGLKWLSYEDLMELSELRRSTTAIGHLPMRLVMLLAADAADGRLGSAEKIINISF